MTKLNRLRLARLETNKSQWEISRETGIAQSLISLYERELVTPKSVHKEKLAKLYGKKVEELWK